MDSMRNLVRKYALAEATNPMAQQAFDYGTAGLVGAAGQQLANWATGGDDPNPLLSGALFSPLGALAGRAVRNKYMSPTLPSSQALGMALDESIAGRNMVNPLATGALMASATSGLASAGTNAYNLVTGSNAEPSTAINALSSIAPLSYFLLGQRNRNQSSPFVGLPSPRV